MNIFLGKFTTSTNDLTIDDGLFQLNYPSLWPYFRLVKYTNLPTSLKNCPSKIPRRLKGSAKALDIWRLETKIEAWEERKTDGKTLILGFPKMKPQSTWLVDVFRFENPTFADFMVRIVDL